MGGGGGQNKLRGVSKNHEKINVSPVYFEPESRNVTVCVFRKKCKQENKNTKWFCSFLYIRTVGVD